MFRVSTRLCALAFGALALTSVSALSQTSPSTTKPSPAPPPPSMSQPAKPSTSMPATTGATTATMPKGKKVNINTATAEELDALPQIGEKRSAAIMAGRPYKATDELVKKKVLSEGVYEKIKGEISVR